MQHPNGQRPLMVFLPNVMRKMPQTKQIAIYVHVDESELKVDTK